MSLTVSILQGGTNSHQTSSEEVNYFATDFVNAGVVGTITNTAGVAPATGSFAVNAQASPNMTVAVSAGACYVTATPTSGNSQKLRVKNSATQNVTISANSTGGTRYDWVYAKIDPDKAKDPDLGADDVATLVTSRSTSSVTDNGTPPTYGTLIAVVTVANAASSIANGNISDRRTAVTFTAVGVVTDGTEVLQYSPGVSTDANTSGSFTDWLSIGSLTIPSWCTTVFLNISVNGVYTITSTSEHDVKATLGTVDGRTVKIGGTTTTSNDKRNWTWNDSIVPGTTGSTAIKLQSKRTTGTGSHRADANSDITVLAIYR